MLVWAPEWKVFREVHRPLVFVFGVRMKTKRLIARHTKLEQCPADPPLKCALLPSFLRWRLGYETRGETASKDSTSSERKRAARAREEKNTRTQEDLTCYVTVHHCSV